MDHKSFNIENFTPHEVIVGKHVFPVSKWGSFRLTQEDPKEYNMPIGNLNLRVVMPPKYNGLELVPTMSNSNEASRATEPGGDFFSPLNRSFFHDLGITHIIVSSVTAEWICSHSRREFDGIAIFSPDSNPQSAIRNAVGQIIGVKRLIWYQ